MTQIMVHDYSECVETGKGIFDSKDFSKERKYPMDSIDAIKLINDIIYNDKPHNFAFYTMEDEYLLDLS